MTFTTSAYRSQSWYVKCHEDLRHRHRLRGARRGRGVLRHGQRRHLLRHRRGEDRGPQARRDADLRAGPRQAGHRTTSPRAACCSRPTSPSGVAGAEVDPARGRHAARPRRLRRSVVHLQGRRAGRPRRSTGWAVHRDQVDGPRRHRRQDRGDRQEAREARVRGRVEPRVPQGRRRGQRLHEARPRRHRRRRQARGRHAARALRAVHAHRATASW